MITPSFSLTATERVLPKLALDFTTASLDPRITFSRAGAGATVFNSAGDIQDVSADTPRFDYNPSTLVCKGLLIEESRTNVLTNTLNMALANAATSAGQVSDVAGDVYFNYFTSGIQFSTPSVTTSYYKQYTFTSLTAVFSFFVIMDDLSEPKCAGVASAADDFGIIIDGSVKTSGFVKTDLGSGRWRIDLPFTDTSYSNGYFGIQSRTTNSGKGFKVYGFQLEAGAFATSYIPTTSAALTRNADVATMTGTNFSDWFNASEGTIQSIVTSFGIDGSLSANRRHHWAITKDANLGTDVLNAYILSAGVTNICRNSGGTTVTMPLFGGTQTNGTIINFVTGFNGSTADRAVNTTTTANTAASLTLANMNTLSFGQQGDTLRFLNGHLQKFNYWPMKLTNAEIQSFSKG